jgi:hypothetical protein
VVVAALRLEGNVGEPHELAAMGLLLASDEASYVNGQAIPVDRGLTASMPYVRDLDSYSSRPGLSRPSIFSARLS